MTSLDAPADGVSGDLAAWVFPPLPDHEYVPLADDELAAFAAAPESDPEVAPFVVARVGTWVARRGVDPEVVAVALVVEAEGGAAQDAADDLASTGEEVGIEGQPCYRSVDASGNRQLALATPELLLYLTGSDDDRLLGVAHALLRAWRESGRA